MNEVSELLKLLHDANRRIPSLTAEYSDHFEVPATRKLEVTPRPDGRFEFNGYGGGLFPRSTRVQRSLWYERPSRLRVEVRQAGRLVIAGVRTDLGWSEWDRTRGVRRSTSSPSDRDSDVPVLLSPTLLAPERLLAWVVVDSVRPSSRMGRDVLVATAMERRWSPVPPVARSFVFEFDAETGMLLRRETFDGERRLALTEAIAVAFNPPLEGATFRLDLIDANRGE